MLDPRGRPDRPRPRRPSKRTGQLENTLIFVTADNGSSGEGGLTGSFNETYVLNGLQTPFDANMEHYEGWGGPDTYPHFHAGWALAGNTPFQYFKQIVHRGWHPGRPGGVIGRRASRRAARSASSTTTSPTSRPPSWT